MNVRNFDYLKGLSLSKYHGYQLVVAHLTNRESSITAEYIDNLGILLFSKYNPRETLSYTSFTDISVLAMVQRYKEEHSPQSPVRL